MEPVAITFSYHKDSCLRVIKSILCREIGGNIQLMSHQSGFACVKAGNLVDGASCFGNACASLRSEKAWGKLVSASKVELL